MEGGGKYSAQPTEMGVNWRFCAQSTLVESKGARRGWVLVTKPEAIKLSEAREALGERQVFACSGTNRGLIASPQMTALREASHFKIRPYGPAIRT